MTMVVIVPVNSGGAGGCKESANVDANGNAESATTQLSRGRWSVRGMAMANMLVRLRR